MLAPPANAAITKELMSQIAITKIKLGIQGGLIPNSRTAIHDRTKIREVTKTDKTFLPHSRNQTEMQRS